MEKKLNKLMKVDKYIQNQLYIYILNSGNKVDIDYKDNF